MEVEASQKIPLLDVLVQLAPESSKNTLRSWVSKGRVYIDGSLATHASQMVEEGQKVSVGAKPKFLSRDLKIVYEDKDLVVVDKPAGLLSVAKEIDIEISAHAILKQRYNQRKVYPIHRLDKDTSGLLIFAYTENACHKLKEQLEKRTLYREYRARVHGHPGAGTWRSSLEEDTRLFMKSTSGKKGKEAITHFETIQKQKKTAVLKIRLETGRKHQIRVQAAEAGFPIVGDAKYGKKTDRKLPFELRAVAVCFIHPTSSKKCMLTS